MICTFVIARLRGFQASAERYFSTGPQSLIYDVSPLSAFLNNRPWLFLEYKVISHWRLPCKLRCKLKNLFSYCSWQKGAAEPKFSMSIYSPMIRARRGKWKAITPWLAKSPISHWGWVNYAIKFRIVVKLLQISNELATRYIHNDTNFMNTYNTAITGRTKRAASRDEDDCRRFYLIYLWRLISEQELGMPLPLSGAHHASSEASSTARSTCALTGFSSHDDIDEAW